MSNDPRTGFDFHVPSSAIRTIGPIIGSILAGMAVGGGGATFTDVSGARAYKESKAEEIAQVKELKREVAECRAQKAQILDLLDGATLREDIQ